MLAAPAGDRVAATMEERKVLMISNWLYRRMCDKWSRNSAVLLFVAIALGACDVPKSDSGATKPVSLIPLLKSENIQNSPAPSADLPEPLLWNFKAEEGASTESLTTQGWEALSDVAGFAASPAGLTCTTAGPSPILHFAWTGEPQSLHNLHSIVLKAEIFGGETLSINLNGEDTLDLEKLKTEEWMINAPTPIVPGIQTHTFLIDSPGELSSLKHILIRPTNAPGIPITIESVRLVTREEYLAEFESGLAWQGLGEIYHETWVARAPESIDVTATLPARPWLDLDLGTAADGAVSFKISAQVSGQAKAKTILERTVTTPHRWEPVSLDLAAYAGKEVTFSLEVAGEEGIVGLWGSPVIRSRTKCATSAQPNVILILVDTLRSDHLNAYDYERPTAPNLQRMASEGALFRDCITQATWTKASVPSILTSLYPISNTVHEMVDRVPNSANTIAEVFRSNGYATISMSSVPFSGKMTNLHQGFEEVHEVGSLRGDISSKTSREYNDRLLPWIEEHRDGPFFAYFHLFDPHDPFEPHRPYNTMWADPNKKAEHRHNEDIVRPHIAHPVLKQFCMPSRTELEAAGVDPDSFTNYNLDWYDGSIREMDAEIGRLLERLDSLGLAENTIIAFTSDHGEEFLDHGASFHGQTVYGELTNVPLIFWSPGRIDAGTVVADTVSSVDIMPTLLEAAGIPVPGDLQGQSLAPLLTKGAEQGGWEPRPAFIEKAKLIGPGPGDTGLESYGIVDGQWRLIHHVQRPEGAAEFELYDHRNDPLNQTDIVADHPKVVESLAKQIADWRLMAEQQKLEIGDDATEGITSEELERLKSLGYI